MKVIFVSICVCFIVSCTSVKPTTNQDFVLWNSKKKLQWDDFLAPITDTSRFSAVSSVVIKYSYKFKRDKIAKFKVGAYFIRNKSFVNFDRIGNANYLLEHEQKHFDIGEIFARKLKKTIFEEKQKNNRITDVEVDSIIKSVFLDLEQFQRLYDDQTNHSLDVNQQEIWNELIQNALDSLKNYK